MFREVARKKQALSREECIEILKSENDYIDNETAVFLKDTAMFYIVPEHITGKRVNES